MMSRRAQIAIVATLVAAAIAPALSTPATSANVADASGWSGIADVLAHVVAPAAAGVAALAGAVVMLNTAGPHARQIVRTMRARRIRRRARTTNKQRTARLVVTVIAGGVLGVALVTVALNYAHGMDVARANAETGWRAWLYPLPADGLLIVSSMVLVWQMLNLEQSRDGMKTWAPRLAFVLGIVASAGTNVLAALHDPNLAGAALVERIIWTTWPTVGLLAAHETLLMLLGHYARQADVFGVGEPDPEVVAAQEAQAAAEARAAAAETNAQAAVDEAERRAQEAANAAQEQIAQLTGQVQHLEQGLHAAEVHSESRQREIEKMSRDLAELNSVEDHADRTSDDWTRIKELATRYVQQERAERPSESLVADVVRLFAVSPRWVQQQVPAAKELRPDRPQLQLA